MSASLGLVPQPKHRSRPDLSLRSSAIGHNVVVQFTVAADDRTGALETAAAMADAGVGPVSVVPWGVGVKSGAARPGGQFIVFDLGSRHLVPAAALARAGSLRGELSGHKMDSTLRGNWAAEVAGRLQTATAALVIPALPALGRTCVDGVVLDHGQPVHLGAAGSDVRRRVTTSRPAESLRAAGVVEVVELASVAAARTWLGAPSGVAVLDASDEETIVAATTAWCAAVTVAGSVDVVLVGTSAVMGAAAAAISPERRSSVASGRRGTDGPVLIACGSVHPAARTQLAWLERHGVLVSSVGDDDAARELVAGRTVALSTELPVGEVTEATAVAVSAELASRVHSIMERCRIGALVLIGGDTAAAVLGDAAVLVEGSIGAGTAVVTAEGLGVPVVARPGGFGSETALAELIWDVLGVAS